MAGSNVYKVTWTFVEANGASFSEIYYATGNTPADLLPQSAQASTARLNLCDPSVTWQKIRVANVTGARSTAQRVVNWPGTYAGGGGPAPAGVALVGNLVGSAGGSRKVWMRGMPDAIVLRADGTGRDVFNGYVTTQWNAYVNGIAAYGYGLRQLTQTQKYTIASVDGTAANGTAIITVTTPSLGVPPTWNYPTRVVISGADKKTLPGLNGHWTVITGSNGAFTIKYQVAGNLLIKTNAGSVKQEGYSGVSVFAPNLSQPAYWGGHTTKNPTTNSRGARRAVRIRSLA